jgi:hypothetical protein
MRLILLLLALPVLQAQDTRKVVEPDSFWYVRNRHLLLAGGSLASSF